MAQSLPSASPAANATPQRIVVVGATGSGKTHLADQLTARLGYPRIELDALHWEADWQPAPREVFRARVQDATARPQWIADGNYSKVRDIVWARADTLIWLDYPLPMVLGRLLRRTTRRVFSRQLLWNSNRETWGAFLGRDSLVMWLFKSHPRHRREYPALFRETAYAHLRVHRLTHPDDARRLLANLRPES
jgi:hypothetical protein